MPSRGPSTEWCSPTGRSERGARLEPRPAPRKPARLAKARFGQPGGLTQRLQRRKLGRTCLHRRQQDPHEGVAGLSTAFGGASGFEAIGQLAGEAARVRGDVLRALLRQFRPLRGALLRYTDVALGQAQQSAVCHASHRIEQRCARWLLVAHDRVGRDELPVTHDFLALMLGVRRASVTVALGLLRRAGCIAHSRAVVRVVGRSALEAASCECYRTLRAGRERVERAVQKRSAVVES